MARTRLFKVLDRSCRRPMVWFSAPAGAGKTTLAASYAQARRLPILWYQVNETDVDIATFFHYFSLAVTSLNRRSRLPAFTAVHFPSLMAFTRRYFEAAVAALPSKTVIVLDNYQELPETAALHAVLHQVIDMLPRGMTLIVLSRNDPPAVFCPAQARRLIAHHDADALRLTERESLAVATLLTPDRVSRNLARECCAQAGGWAAGLTLLLERARHRDPAKPAPDESHEVLFNYLASETFAQMSPRMQTLLLKTALLPHVSVTVAEQVTEFPDSGALLAELNHRYYFTLRLAGLSTTYQYHPLFREFLLSEARRRMSPEEIRTVERTAAAALQRNGQLEEAIELLLRAKDWTQASAILLTYAPALMGQGRKLTLVLWLNTLPEEFRQRSPWLSYWQGMCEMMSNPPRALELFSKSYSSFEAHHERTGQALAIAGAMDAIYISQAEQSTHDSWIARFEKLVRRDITFPCADIEGRIWSSVILTTSWRQPEHPQLSCWMARAEDVYARATNIEVRLTLGSTLSFFYGVSGCRAKTIRYTKTLRHLLSAHASVASLNTIHCRLYLSYLDIFLGNIDSARRTANEALVHADSIGMHAVNAHVMGSVIYADLLDANLPAADVNLARMNEWLAQFPENLDTAHLEMLHGWRALLGGDPAVAREHAERSVRIASRIGAVYPERLCRYGLAHVLVEQGDLDSAIAEIHRARLSMGASFGAWMNYQCDMLLAHLEFRRGQEDAGFRRLRAAMIRGREGGFSQPLWFRPGTLAELCTRALAKGFEDEHVQVLIGQRRLLLPATGGALSAREREILTLVAKALNRAEIGRTLGISPTTVATHIGAIYRKLDISSRSEATFEAIRLGLIRL